MCTCARIEHFKGYTTRPRIMALCLSFTNNSKAEILKPRRHSRRRHSRRRCSHRRPYLAGKHCNVFVTLSKRTQPNSNNSHAIVKAAD